MIFYYSGCGNSKYVAEQLCKPGERLFYIPELIKSRCLDFSIDADERLGFVFPVYAWAPPQIVSDFVGQMHLQTQPDYTFMVVTCGDDCGRTEQIFRSQLQQVGLSLQAAQSVQMPNTYVNMPGMDVDSIDLQQRKIHAAQEQLRQLSADLDAKKAFSRVRPGAAPRIKSYVIKPWFDRTMLTDKKYHVTDACVGCGICVGHCPVQNVLLVNDRPQWQHNCLGCTSCYQHCPHHAIQFGSATEKKGQYYFRVPED